MLIDFSDDRELLDQLIKHNLSVKADVGDLLPPIQTDKLQYDRMASQHLSLVLRLFARPNTSPITKQRFSVKDDDRLADEVKLGHKNWILKSNIQKVDAEWVARVQN